MPLFLLFINFIEGVTDQSAAYRREKSPVLGSSRAKLWHKTNLGHEKQINKRSKAQDLKIKTIICQIQISEIVLLAAKQTL